MKPAWFRIHLSTALVLVFAASGFIALNLLPSPPGTQCCGLRPSADGPAVQVIASDASPQGKATFQVQWKFGFPEMICKKIYEIEARNDATVGEVLAKVPVTAGEFGAVDQSAILQNIFDALIALFFLAICCEIVIRFRARKRQTEGGGSA